MEENEKVETINKMIEEQWVEQVNQFCYFGSLISDDENGTAEIKRRIAMAKNALKKRRVLF